MVAFGQLARCQQADLITTKGRAFVRIKWIHHVWFD